MTIIGAVNSAASFLSMLSKIISDSKEKSNGKEKAMSKQVEKTENVNEKNHWLYNMYS